MIRSALALSLLIGIGAVASAADYRDEPDYGWSECEEDSVLAYIGKTFAWAERNTFRTGLEIAGFEDIRETPVHYDRPGYIDRIYCRADAWISDGSSEPVFYMIARPLGFAGYGRAVYFCLPQYDRWHVHGASCRSLKP
jgi:hypothetical protein